MKLISLIFATNALTAVINAESLRGKKVKQPYDSKENNVSSTLSSVDRELLKGFDEVELVDFSSHERMLSMSMSMPTSPPTRDPTLDEMDFVEETIHEIIYGNYCNITNNVSSHVTYTIKQATAPYLNDDDDYMGKEEVWSAQGNAILLPYLEYCCSTTQKECETRIIQSLGLPIDNDQYSYGFHVGYDSSDFHI